MPVCGYVVVPSPGAKQPITASLSALPGCEVVGAENADLLLLVTTTADAAADAALRHRIEALPGVDALLLTFGEIQP